MPKDPASQMDSGVAKKVALLRRYLDGEASLGQVAAQANTSLRTVKRPLTPQELAFVLTHRWRQLGLTLDQADFTDAQAVASIVRITGGNFRLVHRLFAQIERVLKINGLHAITEEVVETARSALVIGAI